MWTFICTVLFGVLCLPSSTAKRSSPQVQVYSREPGFFGKENTLICHVSRFHPPEISIELLRNRKVIPGSRQTDLTFEESWFYHLTKHVPFNPKQGEEFACNVTHMGNSNIYIWEPDM